MACGTSEPVHLFTCDIILHPVNLQRIASPCQAGWAYPLVRAWCLDGQWGSRRLQVLPQSQTEKNSPEMKSAAMGSLGGSYRNLQVISRTKPAARCNRCTSYRLWWMESIAAEGLSSRPEVLCHSAVHQPVPQGLHLIAEACGSPGTV